MDNNLNPIREEVDLGDKKKTFKNKVIRIKKLVKKDNGEYTLKDQTVLNEGESLNESNLRSNILENINEEQNVPSYNFKKPKIAESIFSKEGELKSQKNLNIIKNEDVNENKNQNKMFHSTNFNNSLKSNFKVNANNKGTNKNLMRDSIFCDNNYFNNKMNTENLTKNIRNANNMYNSQVINMTNINLNNQLFRLPKNIENFMANLDNFYIKYNNIKQKELNKSLDKLSQIKKQILSNFNNLESKIRNTYEDHNSTLDNEINILKSKINNYKFFKNNNINQEEDTIITINELCYFNKKDNNKFLKNEKYEMDIKAKDYDLFINRRSLVYYKELVEKKWLHMPEFGVGDSSDMVINDFIKNINIVLSNEIENLFPLIDEPYNINIGDIGVKPNIKLNNKIGLTGFGDNRNFKIEKILTIQENLELGNFEKLVEKHLSIDQKIPNICMFTDNKIRTLSSEFFELKNEVTSTLSIKVIKNYDIKFFDHNFYEKLKKHEFIHFVSSKVGLLGIYFEEYGKIKFYRDMIKINKGIVKFRLFFDNYQLFILLDDNSINVFNLNSFKFTSKQVITDEKIIDFEFFNKNELIIFGKSNIYFYQFDQQNNIIYKLNFRKKFSISMQKIMTYNNFLIGYNSIEKSFYYYEESKNKSTMKKLNLKIDGIKDFLLIPNIIGSNNDFMILVINDQGNLIVYDNITKKNIVLNLEEQLNPYDKFKIELIQLKETHFNILVKIQGKINYYKLSLN